MVVHELADRTADDLFDALADRTRRDILRRCRSGAAAASSSSAPEPGAVDRARRALDELETTWRGRVDRMAGLLTDRDERTQ